MTRWEDFIPEHVSDHIDEEEVRWWYLGWLDSTGTPLHRAGPEGDNATTANAAAYAAGLAFRAPSMEAPCHKLEQPDQVERERQELLADLIPKAWLRTLSDVDLDTIIERVPADGPLGADCDRYGWQQTIDGDDYRLPIEWAKAERQIRGQLAAWSQKVEKP